MIQMIQMALTYGYTASQVLKYVSNKVKSASAGISQAQQQGYSDEDILKFLSGKVKPKNQKAVDRDLSAQERYMKSVGMKTKGEKEETRNKFISGALGVGATALGAYGLYKNYGGMGQTFGSGNTLQNTPVQPTNTPVPGAPINPPPQAPQSPGQMATPQTPMPQGMTPGQQLQQGVEQPIQDAMQPQGAEEIAQAAQAMPQEQQQPQSLFEQLTGKLDPNRRRRSRPPRGCSQSNRLSG